MNTFMLLHVISAVKRVRNATLPKLSDDRIMGNYADVGRKRWSRARGMEAHAVRKIRAAEGKRLRRRYWPADATRRGSVRGTRIHRRQNGHVPMAVEARNYEEERDTRRQVGYVHSNAGKGRESITC